MDKSSLENLLYKFKTGTLDSSERLELDNWYISEVRAGKPLNDPEAFEKRLLEMDMAFPFVAAERAQPIKTSLWPRIIAAASIILIIGAGIFYYSNHNNSPTLSDLAKMDEQIKPGHNKAYLTLSNGKKIALEDAANGELAKESSVVVSKTVDGQLIYSVNSTGASDENKFNMIETPKGGQYQVLLPDGSKVWLNAMSSLRYPVQFTSKERLVELKGEGYFEVAHNASKPFRVRSVDQTVEVLGTHFNVNSYKDNGLVKTTLLEGSVQVLASSGNKKIIPGEQAAVDQFGSVAVTKIDLEFAIAWKKGEFMFDDQDITSVMKMIERWYDVEVIYEGKLPRDKFLGSVSRFDKLSKVLTMLEGTGRVKFRAESRKIFVSR